MRRSLALALVLGLLLLCGSSASAADKDISAIIDKAIKAHGGAEKLDPARAVRVKAKGTMDLGGTEVRFTIEGTQQAGKTRDVIQLSVGGQEVSMIQVFNGSKGWQKLGGETKEAEGDQLDLMKESAYRFKLEGLLFLRDKSLALSPAGEAKVNGRPAVGIKVVSKGHKDVKLFFDKESGLLIKSEYTGTDPMTMQNVAAEQIWHDYQDVDGQKVANKAVLYHDGKKFVETEILEVTFPKTLDKKEFEEP
jgi:hypothetical protein